MQDFKTLETEISKLTTQVARQNSLKRIFFISVLRGFATALGATLVFSLVIAWLVSFLQKIDYVPLITNILNSPAFETLVGK